jgi:alcohol dehydrogenase
MRGEVFSDVEANPKDTDVAAAARAYADTGADCIIAVGGGSAIDCAKAAGVLIASGKADIAAAAAEAPAQPIPTLIAVPTTAGTGSELTFSAVITDTARKYKMTVKTPYTAPAAAVCDPELTLSVPPHVTAATGMDALTHAIEAFTATGAQPISDAAALYAMELIAGNLEKAVRDGSDIHARSAMLMGSMLAGIAFSRSDVASVHCVAEALGGMYDLPHGVCNAVILPHMMEYNMGHCIDRYARVADAIGAPVAQSAAPEAKAEGAVEAVRSLARAVDLPSFASLGVAKDDHGEIARKSASNLSTPSNPRPMAEEDYLELLRIMSE